MSKTQIGYLAKAYCKVELPLQVLKSAAGFYIGTFSDEDGPDGPLGPMTRESDRYWPTREAAQEALDTGDWPQKPNL